MFEAFETHLAGARHRPIEVQLKVQQLKFGQQLTLARQPENEFDPNAIQVYAGEEFIGFIPKKRAATLAPYMDAGMQFSCIVASENGLDPILSIAELAPQIIKSDEDAGMNQGNDNWGDSGE